MGGKRKQFPYFAVAPRVGAWIETYARYDYPRGNRSLPVWERGLKQEGLE